MYDKKFLAKVTRNLHDFVFFSNHEKPFCASTNNEASEIKRSTRPISSRPNKQLPEKAIHLMNAWYLAHEDNPYPNRNDLDYLATNGGIKESQVKAWFSNKRNRTQNTHPKRAKRYAMKHLNEPNKLDISSQLEQRFQVDSFSQDQQNISTSFDWSRTFYPFENSYCYPYSSSYQTHC